MGAMSAWLAVVMVTLAGVAPGQQAVTRADLQGLVPPGYRILATAEGDFDGDGLCETVVSIADPAIEDETEFMAREDAGAAVPARVFLVKPGAQRPELWCELPLEAGSRGAARSFDELCAVDLLGDRRPELFACGWQRFMGNTGIGDVHLFTCRKGRFEEIWSDDDSFWRWAALGCCEVSASSRGLELVVVRGPDDPYSHKPQRHRLSVYGYWQGRYRLLSERMTTGLYTSAGDVLERLGAERRVLPP
jgi:hypothetical protein